MREWLVTADDRTGALEAAAEIATTAGVVVAAVREAPAGSGVIDLATRGESSSTAATRAAGAPVAGWNAHKIDSTLRGNWAHEVRARAAATGLRVLVIPGWPALGRTCVGGVVHVHGSPVGVVREHLPEADLLAEPDAVRRWLDSDRVVGAADIADTAQLDAVAAAVAAADVLIVAPAGPIGAVHFARFGGATPAPPPPLAPPVVVVCGSATALSREQVRRFRAARPDATVFQAPDVADVLHVRVATELATAAAEHVAGAGTVVLIGGDTAAAVLGDAPRRVGGTVQLGMPWSRDVGGGGPVVITKAGGFGDLDALVRLGHLISGETG